MNNFLTNEELQAVAEVVEHGRQWGYGNMISRLRIGWVLALRKSVDRKQLVWVRDLIKIGRPEL